MTCEGCGNTAAYQVRTFWVDTVDGNGVGLGKRQKHEVCDKCGNASPEYPRDGLGNKVDLPESNRGKFSYATGTEMTSSRQYGEVLRRMNLGQKEA